MIHLEVYGHTWGGARAVYSYAPKASAAEVIANPSLYAGDFASLIDFRVVEETNTYEGKGVIRRRIDTFKTHRGFRNGMTPRRFYRLANGG
jgi:hypothetical protein